MKTCTSSSQMRLTPISPRVQSQATLLFNRLARVYTKPPIICDKDETNHAILKCKQSQENKEAVINRIISLLLTKSTVVVQQ